MKTSFLLRGLEALLLPRPKTRAQVTAYQERCLRALVAHAYRRVPFYRRVFDQAGLKPSDIRTLADLSLIPITTRQQLQQAPPEDLCESGAPIGKLRKITTSGSTGEPLTVRRTWNEERLLLALRARSLGAFGMGFGMRRATIDYFSVETFRTSSRRQLWQRFGILPKLLIDWKTPKPEIVAAIERFRPHVVGGPPSILSWLADELDDEDRRRMSPRLMISYAETLTPLMREQIERGFGVPVADAYGCHEVIFLAMHGTDRRFFRVADEAVIVEVLRDGRPAEPGESGELVATALHFHTMPFIRYLVGDEVVRGDPENPSTNPFSSLVSVTGRTTERFTLPGGRGLHPCSFSDAIKESGLPVRRFQVEQPSRERFLVRLALYHEAPEQTSRLQSTLRQILGPECEVEIEQVETLQQTTHKKFKPYIPFRENSLDGAGIHSNSAITGA